jgi:uncharacterized membrane protein SpoIIM required for sporulation
MAELQLKSHRFRAEREQDWRRLERLVAKAEKEGARKLKREEILELPLLYRQALSSLSVARSISLDQSLIAYLESLCTRSYFIVYGARARLGERVARFFLTDWPGAVRALWAPTLISGILMALGALVAFLLVSSNPEWFYSVIPPEMAQGRDPSASREALRETLYADLDKREGLTIFATFLFTNNAQVALFAFALGFALCVPTAALMVYNGCVLGAMLALFGAHGLTVELVGWLLIHGVTELLAIVIAGAAGFSLGWAVAFPGDRSRVDAAMEAGRRAATVMIGVVIMLLIAGLLVGYARQLVHDDIARYATAGATGMAWLAYFYWPRRR